MNLPQAWTPQAGASSSSIMSSLDDTTVIIVTHNQEDFLSLTDRFVGYHSGRKVVRCARRRNSLLEHRGHGCAPASMPRSCSWCNAGSKAQAGALDRYLL
ncbi:MAG: hypothetical protein MZV70_37130 [Desulfobacterales bacterium]|nr:hypothetical protein [Desulfobacterales bacterium]